jgi:ribose/xylose/arabinose/galactoside ABC-type transport system permease subunit
MTKQVASDGAGSLHALMRSREASLVLLIVILTAVTTALNPRFLSPQSLKDLMLNVSIIALLVLGQTVIILMRQIDLSISSTVGITAFLSGTLFISYPGIPGLVVVLLAVFSIGLRQYRAGREYCAIGSNPSAAVLAGINVSRRVATGFMISGAVAGLAGALWLARFGTVDATAGEGIELGVITSTVVGGVAITGGVGTVAGAVLGALLLSVFSSTLVFLRVPSFWQQAFQGAMLLIAVAMDAYLAHRHALRSRVKWSHV